MLILVLAAATTAAAQDRSLAVARGSGVVRGAFAGRTLAFGFVENVVQF